MIYEARPQHVAWDGLTLRHDDPWWQVHYPPNGWGCKCYVEALSPREAERAGGTGEAPPTKWREVRVGTRVVRVADGVDAGFSYAPGRAAQLGEAVRHRLRASLRQPADIASSGVAAMLSRSGAAQALRENWRDWRGNHASGSATEVGALLPGLKKALERRRGEIATATIKVAASDWRHAIGAAKGVKALDRADWDRLTDVLAPPVAILYEREKDALLYVFEPVARAEKMGKAVVQVNVRRRVRRQDEVGNYVRSGQYVQPENLRDRRYEVLWGQPPKEE